MEGRAENMTVKKDDTKKLSTWKILSAIDCSDHVEEKGGLTYLSWAWAWKTLKDNYPDASFEKHWFTYGDLSYKLPYALDKQGNAFVMVTVTVDGMSVTEVLPVLDYSNRSVQQPNSFLVNVSLQRCLTKAIAYHGLAHYLYRGEDTPEIEAVETENTDVPEDKPEDKEVEKDKVPMTLSEWRSGFLDTGTATETDEGVVMAEGKNLEGWKQVAACFEAFMPSINDTWPGGSNKYKDQDECVNEITNFYKTNKGTIKRMSEEQPEIQTSLIEVFKDAKAAAKASDPYLRPLS
jgi:hypothetical protein